MGNDTKSLIFHGGELVLSDFPSGVSKIRLVKNFIQKDEADCMYKSLLKDVPWVQNSDSYGSDGRYGLQPRLTYWYGELPFTYSQLTHPADNAWHPFLEKLRDRLRSEFNFNSCNSVLCNLYRDNNDKIDWHGDTTPVLRKNPFIASVSLGAVRPFEMRKRVPHDSDVSSNITMYLDNGSLLIMEGSTQDDWEHRLPPVNEYCEPRINFTFRVIYA